MAKSWYEKDKQKPSEIAKRLGRNMSVITRLVVKCVARKKQGRKPALTEPKIDLLGRRLDEMVRKANCKYTVTVTMLKKSTRMDVSRRTFVR